MIESMRPGSIIVDLAVERGGNAELAKPGEIVKHQGVRIFGKLNLPGQVPVNASSLYARNLQAFVEPLIDKEKKTLAINWDDDIVKGTVTRSLSRTVRRTAPSVRRREPRHEGTQLLPRRPFFRCAGGVGVDRERLCPRRSAP
jgi:alanine dehydrogenase